MKKKYIYIYKAMNLFKSVHYKLIFFFLEFIRLSVPEKERLRNEIR